MMSQGKSLALARVLQRLLLLRLFLPLAALSVIAICGAGYLGMRTLEHQQHQRAQSMARIVDHFLDQAARTLDAVARVAEVSPTDDLMTYMQGTWEAYGYFDTLYFLDVHSKITLLAPPDQRYLGLDMSNLPYFQQAEEKKKLAISRPFISLRTGNATVYLVRQLAQGGRVVGELNLGLLQDEIAHGKDVPGQDTTFLMDQSGMLLAHPSLDLVRQQTNQSYLEIFRRGLSGGATLVYEYAGTMVLGSADRVERAGWVVVNQVPLSVSISPYVLAMCLTLLTLLAIWLALTWNLRGQLHGHIVVPLVQLSRGIGALANGDFDRGKAFADIPTAFAELTTLAADFKQMSDALEVRQVALQESEQRYRLVFENSPVSIWEENFSGVKAFMDGLREEGVIDMEAYLVQHPETPRKYADLVKIVDVNQAALTLHEAASKNELLTSLARMLTPEFFGTFREELLCLWNGETAMSSETIIKTQSGEFRNVAIYLSVCPGYEATLSKVLVSLTDITERKRNEKQIIKLSRIHAVLSNINQAIVRIRDTDALLNEACRIVVEYGKFPMAWVGMVNSQTNRVEARAFFGAPAGYLASIDIDLGDPLRNDGPTGIAVRTGTHGISNDIAGVESTASWRDDALRFGYKSCAIFPLVVFGKNVGAFNLYSGERFFFNDDEIKLFDEMAKDLSFALEYGQSENERKLAQTELARLNAELERRVEERTDELETKNRELESLNKMFIGRELRMVELKERIKELEAQSG